MSVKYVVVLVSAKTGPFYNTTIETKMGLDKVVHSNNLFKQRSWHNTPLILNFMEKKNCQPEQTQTVIF